MSKEKKRKSSAQEILLSHNGVEVLRYKGTERIGSNFFPFTPTTPEEIFKLRCDILTSKTDQALLVYSESGKLFYTMLPRNYTMTTAKLNGKCSRHLCADCRCCIADPDDENSCPKVLDYNDKPLLNAKNELNIVALLKESAIEKYSFINYGFEYFNARQPTFYVGACKRFRITPPRGPVNIRRRKELLDSLREYTEEPLDSASIKYTLTHSDWL